MANGKGIVLSEASKVIRGEQARAAAVTALHITQQRNNRCFLESSR